MKKRFVYVGTLEFMTYTKSYGLHALEMDIESGELTLRQTWHDGVNSTFITTDSKGLYLYEANERLDRGDVFAYKIDRGNGTLSSVGQLSLPAAGCVHIANSRNDKYVLVPCCKTSNIISCSVDSGGALIGVSDELRLPRKNCEDKLYPHQIVFNDSGRFLIAPDVGDDKVYVISFDEQTGKMALLHSCCVDSKEGPRHVAFHQNNRWAYVLTEYGKTIYLFDFDNQNGELVQRQKVCLLLNDKAEDFKNDGIQGAEIQVSPDGRFVFASIRGYQTEEGYDSIVRLEIDRQTGELGSQKIFPCYGQCPRMFEFTADGKFILVCNQSNNQVVSLEYDAASGNIGKVCGRVDICEAAVLKSVDILG